MFKRYATKMGNFSIALFFMFLSSGAFTNNALAASTDEYPPSQDSILNGTYEWSRRDLIIANINDKQYSFIDSDPYDSTFQYKIDSRQSICDGKISLSDNSSSASAKIDIDFGPTCNQTSPNAIEKTMGKPENANIWFVWFNQDSIVQVSDGGKADRQYIRESEGSSVFAQKGVDACADKLIVRSGPPPYVNIFRFDKEDGSDPQDLISSGDLNLLKPAGCKLYSTFIIGKVRDKVYNFGLGNTQNASIPPSEKPLDSGSGTTDESPSCEGSIDNGFGWIICPALGLIDNFIDGAEAVIASKLAVDTNTFDGSIETGNDLRETWTVMARIASGLLSIIALIMIISTALGFDFVSAYTLKKVLPRIVIGAIGIWLSWPFAVAYISFMNDLGRGLASLMYAAFPDNISTLGLRDIIGVAAENSDVGTDLAAGAIFTGLAAVSIGSIGIFGLLAAALSVAAAILIGVFVLAIREMLIIVFVVFAPIAVAAWILPNTSKIWKFWSSNFNKLLLMFPMIMGLFAAAKIMAYVSAQAANENPGMLEVLFPIIIFVSPFFFLPKLFKSAGGILTGITGMASKAGNKATGGAQKTVQGLSDARKKVRAEDRVARGRVAQGLGYKVPFTDRRLSSTAGIAQALERSRRGQPLKPLTASSKAAAALGASRAAQEQISTMQKDIDQVLGGDLSARKAIASGQTMDQISASDPSLAQRLQSSGAARFVGDRYAQSAATLGLAQIGKVEESHIRTAAKNFADDKQTASALVSQASRAAKSSGQTSLGSLRYDYDSGGVGYEGMVTNPATGTIGQGIAIDPMLDVNGNPTNPEYITARNESVAKSIASMSAIDQAGLAVDGGEFKDTVVAEALRSNPALATQILNDENVKLTASQRQALVNVGAIPNQSAGGGTNNNQPPNTSGGAGLNMPPNSSAGGPSFS